MSWVDRKCFRFNQFEIGCIQKRIVFLNSVLFSLIVALAPSLIIERFYILSNEHLMKLRLISLDRVL